jgi:methylenetetrahydrofolate reductase (NADPH)
VRFGDIHDHGRQPVSFEIFPPKNAEAEARLAEALPRLIALRPEMITVTYGALGSTRERTLEVAEQLHREHGVETACHLTCVGASRAELDATLDRIRAAGIRNIVALRGDPPKDSNGGAAAFEAAPDGCRHAADLVAHIHDWERRRGVEPLGLAVAGYPEKHPEAPDLATDLRHLKTKLAAGADVVLTQLFFDNRAYFEFVRQAREIGVEAPIVPGLMPILSLGQVERMTAVCGATIPAALRAELAAAGDAEAASLAIGVRHCVEQARGLLAGGAPGVHFYVLNRADPMERIMAGLDRV